MEHCLNVAVYGEPLESIRNFVAGWLGEDGAALVVDAAGDSSLWRFETSRSTT